MKQSSQARGDLNREAQETGENLETQKVQAPNERFQDSQQINPTDEAAKTKSPNTGYIRKQLKGKGAALKQEVVAEAITGKGSGGPDVLNPGDFGLRAAKFSGDTGTILGNVSETPIMDKSAQGGSRVEKRLSDANKDINYLASEQVALEYDNVPPLAGTDTTVGYNGNPKNVSARSQKKTGDNSAELLFDRSLDFIEDDAFIFTDGQVVKATNVDDGAYPTKTQVYSEYDSPAGKLTGWHEESFTAVRGNFSPRALKVSFTKDSDGNVYQSSFQVEEDDFSCNNENPITVNKAATNHRIALNRAEIARQTIDQDAGSPTSEHFNPLGRSVSQPSRTVTYLRDVELSMGSEIFAAYKFAQKARGHFLNRTAKDGQDLVNPAIDALYGHLMAPDTDSIAQRTAYDSARTAKDSLSPFFCKAGMKAGSAASLIAMFDSTGKFKTKADIVTQPRGLKLHLQTADNNMDPFRVNPNFVAALNSVDVYSTIDRGYDPMSTVCITDNVRLVHPFSWKNSFNFTKSGYSAPRTFGSTLFVYSYSAGSGLNKYYIKVTNPVLAAVAYFFDMHASTIFQSLYDSDVDGNSTVTLTVPIVHSTTHFSLWDYLVCAATPYIIYERTNCMKDILDYEMFYRYPFQDLIKIKDANPMNAVNYGNPSALQPLEVKEMLPSSALRWILPEKWSVIGARSDADGSDLLTPFYFSEDSFDLGGTASAPTIMDNGRSNYSTPVLRSGVRNAYLDDFWSMEAKDSQLCYDRLVRLPGSNVNTPRAGYIYKYSQDAEGVPVLRASEVKSLTYAIMHSTPRQLGWFMPAYAGEGRVYSVTSGKVFGELTDPTAATGTRVSGNTSSMRIVQYKGRYTNTDTVVTGILQAGAVAVSRAQAFTQMWACRTAAIVAKSVSKFFDVPVAIGDGFNVSGNNVLGFADGETRFQPYVYALYTGINSSGDANNHYTNGAKLFSMHKILWGIMQKLPFILNPFEDSASASGFIDPMAYAYMFNMAGFMSANYDEEDYNRMNKAMHEGYLYVNDPFINDSPVFKDAMKYTQVG